jgi:hypothetical protein
MPGVAVVLCPFHVVWNVSSGPNVFCCVLFRSWCRDPTSQWRVDSDELGTQCCGSTWTVVVAVIQLSSFGQGDLSVIQLKLLLPKDLPA